jgi:aspartyl protease family protein
MRLVLTRQMPPAYPGQMLNLAVVSRRHAWLCCGAMLLLPTLCGATDVRVVAVTPGQSADVIIERRPPITIEVGETVEGVKLLKADAGGAVLSVDGVTMTLPVVADHSASVGTTNGSTVRLSADARGHFFANGAVNGRTVRFVVDTGASLTTLSRADAQRIGLHYRDGTPTKVMTVNGLVNGWRVSLGTVRVGDTTLRNVDAIVVDNDTLPVALLGMSFLSHFDMQRQESTLVLRRRR